MRPTICDRLRFCRAVHHVALQQILASCFSSISRSAVAEVELSVVAGIPGDTAAQQSEFLRMCQQSSPTSGCVVCSSLPIAWATSLATSSPVLERAKAWNGGGIGKVPLVFGNADEVANGRVCRPYLPQGSLGQFSRHTRLQERPDVAARGKGVDGRQLGRRRTGLCASCSLLERADLSAVGSCLGVRRRCVGRLLALLRVFSLQARPAGNEILVAHSCPALRAALATATWRLLVALTLEEGTLHVMLGDECL